MKIGELIKKKREALHLSRELLAERASITVGDIDDIENCIKEPNGLQFIAICVSLDILIEEILDCEHKEPSEYIELSEEEKAQIAHQNISSVIKKGPWWKH